MADKVEIEERILDSGVVIRSIRYLDEQGQPISQDRWLRHQWIDVTNLSDPEDVRRFRPQGPKA